jgi:nitrogen-specific signal transduction histidine kinase/ActR/RegA family two-component response regulator
MSNLGILIVDNEKAYLDHLVNSLDQEYGIVVGARSGNEAIDILLNRPSDFQFAVIDHSLGEGPDGIETTRELVKLSPNIYPVVFTNNLMNIGPTLARCRYEAMSAGAYRYLGWTQNRKKDINDFITEITQLDNLRNWISGFFGARSATPTLLTQLNVGTDIIDRHFKVWYMNDTMRTIVGIKGAELPKEPCAHWHGFARLPCPGCLVQDSLNDCMKHESIFLSPLVNRRDGELFYLKVWTQPVVAADGRLVTDSDGRPLAVMESVYELTNSAELKTMTLSDRLHKIAQSLLDRTYGDPYDDTRCFQYVRIFIVTHEGGAEQFILATSVGTPRATQLDIPIDLKTSDHERLNKAVEHMRTSGRGYWFEHPAGYDPVVPGEARQPFLYWPILENQKIIALVETGGKHAKRESSELVRLYAREILSAIEDNRRRDPNYSIMATVSSQIAETAHTLQTMYRPSRRELTQEQLCVIVRDACRLTDSQQYILRCREGVNARLLRLEIREYCEYERVAQPFIALSNTQSWDSRTISASVETIVDAENNGDIIRRFRTGLDGPEKSLLESVDAFCYEPLILEGVCIGALGFHSRNYANYRNEANLAIIRLLAKQATLSLHDYLVAEEIREKEEALSEILSLFVHNTKNPLGTAGIALDRLQTAVRKANALTPEVAASIDTVNRQLSLLGRLRDEVLALRRPWKSRIEPADLGILIKESVDSVVGSYSDIDVSFDFHLVVSEVRVDKEALKLCLQELVQNAMDELMRVSGKRSLRIILREAVDLGTGQLGSQYSLLAIDVIDNGNGVAPEMVHSLFVGPKSGKTQGLGIGLQQCRAVALSVQGNVFYDADYKTGAKFTLVLPYTIEGE